jgi:hypothetical protein
VIDNRLHSSDLNNMPVTSLSHVTLIIDRVFFKLDAAKFRQFVKLLDAPPACNPGLERLMAVKPSWARKPAQPLVARKSAKG